LLRGVAVTRWQPLKMLGNIMQQTQQKPGGRRDPDSA
jgi:hypothetical protein